MSEPPRRTCGFRLWATDAVFIVACGVVGWLLRDALGEMVWLVAVGVGHFFLFCNLFRVRRRYELIWTVVFIANVAGWILWGAFSLWGVLAVQAPVTVAVIAAEVCSPRYHGIFCRSINRRQIDRWLSGEIP